MIFFCFFDYGDRYTGSFTVPGGSNQASFCAAK